jgi:hypothetical protein
MTNKKDLGVRVDPKPQRYSKSHEEERVRGSGQSVLKRNGGKITENLDVDIDL